MKVVASLILKDFEAGNGVFPDKNAFTEVTKNQDE